MNINFLDFLLRPQIGIYDLYSSTDAAQTSTNGYPTSEIELPIRVFVCLFVCFFCSSSVST